MGAFSCPRLLTAVSEKPGSNIDVHPFWSILLVSSKLEKYSEVEEAAAGHGET